MDSFAFVFDLIVHVDVHLRNFVAAHGAWVYALLFAIIFVETGFVVTPFVPGDSLLFVVGALCGLGLMSLPLAMALLTVAAIAGNQCNYAIGRHFGPKVFRWEHSRYFNRHAFDMTHKFYEKYGGIMIVAARFMPLLRSFAPFVAGVAEMRRSRFTFFDVTGGALWVVSLTLAGYLFGNIPWVRANLDKIILALLGATVLIAGVGSWRGKVAARRRSLAQARAGESGVK
ncbi:MAG: VTT domain-containing protein [Burkholderiales bacterium]